MPHVLRVELRVCALTPHRPRKLTKRGADYVVPHDSAPATTAATELRKRGHHDAHIATYARRVAGAHNLYARHVSQGATAACKAAAFGHAWFDSRVAHTTTARPFREWRHAMIVRDDLPPTPEWSFIPPQIHAGASLTMPLRFEGDDG